MTAEQTLPAAVTAAIGEMAMSPVEWCGERCITGEMIESLHGRLPGQVQRSHSAMRKKGRFVEGVHQHTVNRAEYDAATCCVTPRGPGSRGGYRGKQYRYLFTEKGYGLFVKSFRDEQAWATAEAMAVSYFRRSKHSVGEATRDAARPDAEGGAA